MVTEEQREAMTALANASGGGLLAAAKLMRVEHTLSDEARAASVRVREAALELMDARRELLAALSK